MGFGGVGLVGWRVFKGELMGGCDWGQWLTAE
jgi:hypothetical protein